jgi:hypothetical protein
MLLYIAAAKSASRTFRLFCLHLGVTKASSKRRIFGSEIRSIGEFQFEINQ